MGPGGRGGRKAAPGRQRPGCRAELGVPRFELVSRRQCHLCVEMAAILEEVLPAYGFGYSVRDADAEPELAVYRQVVPVLLRDGTPVAKVRVDAAQLHRIVRRRR